MTRRLARQDLEFLSEVDRLGREGLNQTEIALRVGLKSAGALHGKVNATGFRMTPINEVRENLTGERLEDLLMSTELVVTEQGAAPEPIAEVA